MEKRETERFGSRRKGFFFLKYFGLDSGFSIKPDPLTTRLKPDKNPFSVKKKKPDPIPYYVNGAGRVPAVAGLLPSLIFHTPK